METSEGLDSGLGAETILGIDNIALELPLAGYGSRVLAGLIDYTVLGLSMLAASIGLGLLVAYLDLSGAWGVALIVIAQFLIHWGYFAGFEIATRGRTPGKMAVQLRTVGSQGGTPSTGALLMRNLLRAIDLLVGVPLMALDARFRRFGDRVAGTLVIHESPPDPEVVLGRIPTRWTPKEVQVVEAYLRRAEQMQWDSSYQIGQKLLKLVQRDDPALLAEVGEYSDPHLALRRALAATES